MARSRIFVHTLVSAAAAALVAGSLTVASPALAASHAGDIQIKGPAGSSYTQGPYVSQSGTEGTTLTFTVRVVNTGPSMAQFNVRLTNYNGAQAQLYDGSVSVTSLASSPDGYYTKALAAGGGNQVLTVKTAIPIGDPGVEHWSDVTVYATDGAYLDSVRPIVEQAAVLTGSTPYDLFLKTGSQKAIGGANTQVMTASTITATGTATFTATLQNSSANPARISFLLQGPNCSNLAVTVKDGLANVTAAALNGTYQTPLLAKAGKRNLTITIKSSGKNPCPFGIWSAYSGPSAGNLAQSALALVNLAA